MCYSPAGEVASLAKVTAPRPIFPAGMEERSTGVRHPSLHIHTERSEALETTQHNVVDYVIRLGEMVLGLRPKPVLSPTVEQPSKGHDVFLQTAHPDEAMRFLASHLRAHAGQQEDACLLYTIELTAWTAHRRSALERWQLYFAPTHHETEANTDDLVLLLHHVSSKKAALHPSTALHYSVEVQRMVRCKHVSVAPIDLPVETLRHTFHTVTIPFAEVSLSVSLFEEAKRSEPPALKINTAVQEPHPKRRGNVHRQRVQGGSPFPSPSLQSRVHNVHLLRSVMLTQASLPLDTATEHALLPEEASGESFDPNGNVVLPPAWPPKPEEKGFASPHVPLFPSGLGRSLSPKEHPLAQHPLAQHPLAQHPLAQQEVMMDQAVSPHDIHPHEIESIHPHEIEHIHPHEIMEREEMMERGEMLGEEVGEEEMMGEEVVDEKHPLASPPLSRRRSSLLRTPERLSAADALCARVAYFAKRRDSLSASPWSERMFGSMVGSYEESIIAGRMSLFPSQRLHFTCDIGVLSHGPCKASLRCPGHLTLSFPACFYEQHQRVPAVTDPHLGRRASHSSEGEGEPPHWLQEDLDSWVSPYVGLAELESTEPGAMLNADGEVQKRKRRKEEDIKGYRLPDAGRLQIVIKNQHQTGVKMFFVPYDFTAMPANTRTFLRQKVYVTDASGLPEPKEALPEHALLRSAIQCHFLKTPKGRLYLYKHLRMVFTPQSNLESSKNSFVVTNGPTDPMYIPVQPDTSHAADRRKKTKSVAPPC